MLWWCEGSGAEQNTEIFLEKKQNIQASVFLITK